MTITIYIVLVEKYQHIDRRVVLHQPQSHVEDDGLKSDMEDDGLRSDMKIDCYFYSIARIKI